MDAKEHCVLNYIFCPDSRCPLLTFLLKCEQVFKRCERDYKTDYSFRNASD